MKTFRIHLKGSNTPQPAQGHSAEYMKGYLTIWRNGRIVAQYLKGDTQGWYEEPTEEKRTRLAAPKPVKARQRGPRPEIALSRLKHHSLSIQ